MSEGLFEFGLPDDGPRVGALVLAVLVPLVLPRRLRRGSAARTTIAVASAAAAALSLAYVHGYLGGGPRIIDATAYWLQAQALAEGWLSWPLTDPEHAVLGRFILRTPLTLGIEGIGDSPGAAVIFPPGYPAVLALGMLIGAPMAVGPALAAALVLATADLAGRVERSVAAGGLPDGTPTAASGQWGAAPIAAVMSALCVSLRYHTADTMAHALAALCMVVGLSAALALHSATLPAAEPAAVPAKYSLLDRTVGPATILGLAGGWLFATRPASALALLIAVALLGAPLARRGRSWGHSGVLLLSLLVGVAPGVTLWSLHQYAATGSLTTTAQAAYYAVSDGPSGCFAYGFGAHVGCRGEHGTFVLHRLQDGYGLLAALGTTARRLEMHVSDAFGFAPLFWLVLLGGWLCRPVRAVQLLLAAMVAQVLCYLPFYFDGSYPGGGARMFAEVLPLEHVLGALALGRLSAMAPRGRPSPWQLLAGTLSLSLLGFAFQTGRGHAQLARREGGRPMFEQGLVERARVAAGLLFLDTDHGFNLAHRPGRDRDGTARYHGDSLDRLVWESLGRPVSYRYRFDLDGERAPALESLAFDDAPTPQMNLRLEAESLWPPVSQQGGWVWPRHTAIGCVSRGRWLELSPDDARSGADENVPTVRLGLPAAALAGRTLTATVYLRATRRTEREPPTITLLADGSAVATWPLPATNDCATLGPTALPAGLGSLQLVLQSRVPVAIDRIDAEALAAPVR